MFDRFLCSFNELKNLNFLRNEYGIDISIQDLSSTNIHSQQISNI